MKDRTDSGDTDNPSIDAARNVPTHPAADAAVLRAFGREAADQHSGQDFDAVEDELRTGWDEERMGAPWEQARPVVRDAFEERVNTEWSDPGNPLA